LLSSSWLILPINDGHFLVIKLQKQKIKWARKDKEHRIHAIQVGVRGGDD